MVKSTILWIQETEYIRHSINNPPELNWSTTICNRFSSLNELHALPRTPEATKFYTSIRHITRSIASQIYDWHELKDNVSSYVSSLSRVGKQKTFELPPRNQISDHLKGTVSWSTSWCYTGSTCEKLYGSTEWKESSAYIGEEGRLLIFGTMVVWRKLLLSEGEGAFKKKIAKKKKKKKETNKQINARGKKTVYLKRNANQQTKLLKSNKWNIRAFFHL